MELRHLRYFIAVAESAHFRRAAQTLGITEPALSRQIKDLERELGVPLFARKGRGTVLSAAGSSLYPDALQIMEFIDNAYERARQIGRGQTGFLRLGLTDAASRNAIIIECIHMFRAGHPKIELSVLPLASVDQFPALRKGQIDVGIGFSPDPRESDFKWQAILAGELVAVVPKNHPLARAHDIELLDLKDHPIITVARRLNPTSFDIFLQACSAKGFAPRIIQEGAGHLVLGLAAIGMGVGLISSISAEEIPRGLRLKRIRDYLRRDSLELVWRKEDESPIIEHFRMILKSVGTSHAAADR